MKQFLKAGLLGVIIAMLAVPVFAGGANQSDGKITLTMSRWAGPHSDDQKVVIKDYVAAHPDINVVIDDIDSLNMKQKQITSIQQPVGKGQYDLVWVFGIWTDEYISNGYVLPLDDYIKKAGIDLSIYSKDFLDKETRNGKLYAMPSRPEVQIMTYNTEWLARDGKSIPKSWDELIALAKYYKEQGTGVALPAMQNDPTTDIYSTILFSEGADYIDPATGRLLLDSEAAKYSVRIWGDLCKYAIVGSPTWHTDQASQATREAKAPFGFTAAGLAMLNGYPDQSAIVNKVAYTPLPTRNPIVSCASFWSWGIAANTAHPQETFDFLAWLVSPETEKKQSMMNGQTTTINSTLNDPEIAAKYPFFGAVKESMQRIKTMPTSINGSAMVERLKAALNEIATTGRNPETVLAEVQAEFAGVDMRK